MAEPLDGSEEAKLTAAIVNELSDVMREVLKVGLFLVDNQSFS